MHRAFVKVGLCLDWFSQQQDFNKGKEETIPESWKVEVEGRPKPAEEEGEGNEDDSICMVCFDGCSTDNNQIVFCDGCNVAVHQVRPGGSSSSDASIRRSW